MQYICHVQLRELQLVNYRNYAEVAIQFNHSIGVFTGLNGSGKTNILDAIHYLSFCKSFLNPIDSQNIKTNEPFLVIQGKYNLNEKNEAIYCGIKRGQKKIFKRNNKEYERLADHIGLLPLVVIAPSDASLISDGSEERRRFMDSVISQFDKPYLDNLMRYNKLIQQRNAYLRSGYVQNDMLDVWDTQLPAFCEPVFHARKVFIERIQPLFKHYFAFISGSKEEAELSYDSRLHDTPITELLTQAREKDRIMQHSTAGIHKDDIGMLLNHYPLKKYASQGQQKSFLIALKLAQFDLMQEVTGLKPILLLDDIFDKLDETRITSLMKLVSQQHFGQIIISDTYVERIAGILNGIQCNFDHFIVDDGKINPA